MEINDAVLFDSPSILDSAVTNIPANSESPLEVIHSLPILSTHFRIIDAIGNYIGMYVGPVGAETLVYVIGNRNETVVRMLLKPGTRISLRSMDNSRIVKGTLCFSFYL